MSLANSLLKEVRFKCANPSTHLIQRNRQVTCEFDIRLRICCGTFDRWIDRSRLNTQPAATAASLLKVVQRVVNDCHYLARSMCHS